MGPGHEDYYADADWVDYGHDDDYDPRADCDHDDYDMDVCTGRCMCTCGHAWYATSEEINAELDRQAEYWKSIEREQRQRWWREPLGWLRDQFDRLAFWRRWRKPKPFTDDDIPF